MIRFQGDAKGFQLWFKGRLFFRHALANPFLVLGKGEGSYRSKHGHYRIRDRITGRWPCNEYRILRSEAERVDLAFPGRLRVSFILVEDRLHLELSAPEGEWNRVWLELPADPGEGIYGCGEQFSELNLRGRKLPLWTQEQGVGRRKDPISLYAEVLSGSAGHWYSTYFPQPTFVSSRGWFCHLEAGAYSEFDFRDPRFLRLHCWQVPSRLILDRRDSLPGLLESLSGLLGRQPALPDWVQDGMWLGVQGGSGEARRKLECALAAGVRVGGLWAQDWEGRRITSFGSQLMWNWEADRSLYPDLEGLIRELGGQGIRFLGYINPFLALEGNLYKEASASGFCVKNRAGEDYKVVVTTFPAALLDLTHPGAGPWLKGVIREKMLGIGLSGWMADYGEYLPTDAVLHGGESAELIHNLYPLLWARLNYEAVAEAGKLEEAVFFMRAGFSGSSRYAPLFWAGDQLVNWSRGDGLPTVVPAALSLGFCAAGQVHADIGGFTTLAWVRRSKELFLRWAELAAFTPLMRTHEGNRPARNWQFHSDAETLTRLARLSELFVRLKGYRLALLADYQRRGLPLMRSLLLHYAQDPVAGRLKYQYLLGPDLLVAPVLRPGRSSGTAYLPSDEWIHLWTGKPGRPGWQRVPAPLGRPPVFYRADSAYAPIFTALAGIS